MTGITRRKNCYLAAVKVGKRQVAKSFPLTTRKSAMKLWRETTRVELESRAPASGTLASDIASFLEGSSAFRPWLNKWAGSTLGARARQDITEADVRAALEAWRSVYSGSSLNHLRQALLSLWRHYDGKGHTCPARLVDKYTEATPRQGFFEKDALMAVLAALPSDLADLVQFASFSGWRRSEVEGLRWSEVDAAGGVIRLSPDRSKNGEGRVLPIAGPLVAILDQRAGQHADLVFGEVGDWRRAWKKAVTAAGVPAMLFHDLRRTVVRNLGRSGVSRAVAMRWSGHKTESVYRRYDIVDEADLRDAAGKLSAYQNG